MHLLPTRVVPARPTWPHSSVSSPTFRGVAYLNHVVEFRAAADLCFADRGAIDGAMRLNFDVIADDGDSALAHLVPGAVGLAREAEAVAADYDAVLKEDAMADAAVLAHGAM